MGFGNTTKQQSQTNSTSTPTEAPNVSAFRNSLYPQIQNQITEASRPVYGQAQQASYLNSLNGLADASIKQLGSTLAGRGGTLNSGAFGSGVSGILQNRQGNIANYNMQTPLLNRQAQQQNMMGALGLATNFAGRAPVGQNTTGTTDTTSTQSQGLGGTLMGLAGAALGGGFPGLAGLLGGGAAGSNSWQQQVLNPYGNQSAAQIQQLMRGNQPNYGPSMTQLGYDPNDPFTWGYPQ